MSFGGYTADDDQPITLATAILQLQRRWTVGAAAEVNLDQPLGDANVVVVASAGNDASCRRVWPAAFDDVIAVGAVGPDGPAPFTNRGGWVTACAPGVDITGRFLDLRGAGAADPQEQAFQGWARWSGTSFAAPLVGAQLAFERLATGERVGAVAARVLHGRQQLRLPGLGTVVDVA